MINGVGVTEFQLEDHAKGYDNDQQPRNPATEDKGGANFVVHDGHIVQGLADGHVAVIGHSCKKKKLCGSKESNKKYLTGTSIICYGINSG